MGRAPCCDKSAVKKGPWSPEEDDVLKSYIEKHGTGGNWISLPQKIGIKRCGKSCRLRWLNYLRPNLKHGGFTDEEDYIICSLYISIGSRWSIIASQLPGRTDNDIKNYWNTKLKKKLLNKEGKKFQELNVRFEVETSSKRSCSSQNRNLMFHDENIKTSNQILDQSSYFGMEEQSLIKNPMETFSWEPNKVWYDHDDHDHDHGHHDNNNAMNGLLASSSSPSLNSISSSCSISTNSSLQMSPYTFNTNHQDMFLTGLENIEAELLDEIIINNTQEIDFRRGTELQNNNFLDHDVIPLIDYALGDNDLFKSR